MAACAPRRPPIPPSRTPTIACCAASPATTRALPPNATWRRTIIDPFGQMFTPFVTMRADVADMTVTDQTGRVQLHQCRPDRCRTRHADCRRRISLSAHQRAVLGHADDRADRPARRPPERDQCRLVPQRGCAKPDLRRLRTCSRCNKFSGWDRVEGGGRRECRRAIHRPVQSRRQRQHPVRTVLSAVRAELLRAWRHRPIPASTAVSTRRSSDYVARASYQPNSTFTFTSRFRFDENDFTLQRTELETTANFGRWTTSVMYGNYAAQPALGFLDRREGILGSARLKVNPNWVLLGAARYDLQAHQVSQTQIGVGYIDDCLILALNYITDYAYSGSVSVNHTVYDAGQLAHAWRKYEQWGRLRLRLGVQCRSIRSAIAARIESRQQCGDCRTGRSTTQAAIVRSDAASRRRGKKRTERRCSTGSRHTAGYWRPNPWRRPCSPSRRPHRRPPRARSWSSSSSTASPITALDIEQRSKLTQMSTHKTPPRQEVIDELINEKLKVREAKKWGLEVTDVGGRPGLRHDGEPHAALVATS